MDGKRAADLKRMLELKVDGIITDRPDQLLSICSNNAVC